MGRILEKLTPSCKDVTRMMSGAMDHRLPLRQRFAISLHRLICVGCDRYYRQLQSLRDQSKGLHSHLEDLSDEKLSPDIKTKIKLAMRRELKSKE
jgi:hypothetical protein